MHHGGSLLMLLLAAGALLLIDGYAYQSLRTLAAPTWLRATYWAALLLGTVAPIAVIALVLKSGGSMTSTGGVAMSALVVLVALAASVALVLVAEDVVRLAAAPVRWLADRTPALLPRARWVSVAALALGGAVLLLMLHGLTLGKYRYYVHRQTVYVQGLPPAFEGFRILQLSDIHAGSLSSPRDVQRGIDMANAQGADLLVFTGDMVNNAATELAPWEAMLAQLRAPYGKFAVLGNHDYGDYAVWRSAEDKAANLRQLVAREQAMGLRVLLDESVSIEKDGQRLALVGVQNIGMSAHFSAYGNLRKALAGVDSSAAVRVLLSHDPSHWDKEVSSYPDTLHLTLSGHTHGFQLGVETRWFRFSPVQWMYPHWAGLYEKNGRYLYVNRGFGFIPFFMGRVGIPPEITVIELKAQRLALRGAGQVN